ncbi:Ankyrin [Coniochaeta hoffmannii]|uniref:Ankyrin n=1 Tax=Coniochaeta hoffmannii TaxID=91930 RepID=A0AA38S3B1_9PEZI|nr:Ankyrin [Coniochaeta hoffmannii]
MPSLTSLPNELVVFILENLNSERDTASLCRVSRRLYEAVSPVLYKDAVDRHDMWPLAFAAFSGNARTMRKILAAGANPDWVFDEANMPRWVWSLLITADSDRVPQPPNTPFGLGQPSQNLPGFDGRPYAPPFGVRAAWSSSSSDMYDDDDLDEDDYEDHGPFGNLHVLGGWAGFPLDPGDYPTDADLDDMDDDMSDENPSDPGISSTDSSTLGSGDRPQNGAGRDHDSPASRFFTTLHVAAAMGNEEAVQVLLDHGASIDTGCRRLCGCKHAAGMLNNLESPQLDLRLPQWTPLHVAICHNRTETARLLLSRGASCMMEAPRASGVAEQYDSTALHHAAALGQAELVKYMVDNRHQTDLDVRDRRTLTPFYYAYANGRWDSTVPLLAQMGADINAEIKFYQPYCTITPLGEAVRLGNFADAQRLLDLGADHSRGFVATGAGHRKGLSPLHLGCMPSARPSGGAGKLFDDAGEAEQRVKIMEAFISKGSDIHSTDCYGDAPLIAAAQNRVLPSVRALIAAGADVNARNSLGRTVVMQAVLGPSNPLPGSLDDNSVSVPESMRVFSGILGALVTAGARIDDVDPKGNNILHLLLHSREPMLPPGIGLTEAIRLLLTYPGAKALLTARNEDGHMAFEVALRAEAHHTYDILLRPGVVQRALTAEDFRRMCDFIMDSAKILPHKDMEFLLDLDVDNKFLSNSAIFRDAVIKEAWSVVALIARRGIPPLDRQTCTELMWRALESRHWDLSHQLIELGADVNAVAGDGDLRTPLWQAIDALPKVSHSQVERLVQILVDKGANIHHSVDDSRVLTRATQKQLVPLVKLMLQNQPLRDDPRAVGGYYLHHALHHVSSGGCCDNPPTHPRIIYTLIHSGADLTEVDPDANYPLTTLLQVLCNLTTEAMPQDIRFFQYCDSIRDLFVPGVDINKPNNKGRSIVSYLDELLQTKAGQVWISPKLELVEDASGAKLLKFKPDMRLRRMPDDRPVTTIWDTRLG